MVLHARGAAHIPEHKHGHVVLGVLPLTSLGDGPHASAGPLGTQQGRLAALDRARVRLPRERVADSAPRLAYLHARKENPSAGVQLLQALAESPPCASSMPESPGRTGDSSFQVPLWETFPPISWLPQRHRRQARSSPRRRVGRAAASAVAPPRSTLAQPWRPLARMPPCERASKRFFASLAARPRPSPARLASRSSK